MKLHPALMRADVGVRYNMNDLAEGERGATVAISCSCFIPDLQRILLSTLISLCWGVGGGVGGGGFGEPYCICNARVWGRDESDSFHILLG